MLTPYTKDPFAWPAAAATTNPMKAVIPVTRIKDLKEPTLFKLKGRNYLSSLRTCFADTFVYCIEVQSGDVCQIPNDAAVETSDFKFVPNR